MPAAVALFAASGGYLIWELMRIPTRPWHLEAFVQARVAECRAGPVAHFFAAEHQQLAVREAEAAGCVEGVGQNWSLLRDYSPCIRRLLSIALDAKLLSLKGFIRAREQEAKLAALHAVLEQELGPQSGNGKIWSEFQLRNIEENRARSLIEQARFLRSRGEIESALSALQRASVSWQRFNHSSNTEFARFKDPALRARWDRDADALLRWTKESGRRAILVDKLEHRCALLSRGAIEKVYPANLGRYWYRPKQRELDAATPEGEYRIRRLVRGGKYGLALLLDYPSEEDRRNFVVAKAEGRIPAGARIGGLIEIHGGGRPDSDWTDGCVALDDEDMRDLYRFAYLGMPVTIVGTSSVSAGGRRNVTHGKR